MAFSVGTRIVSACPPACQAPTPARQPHGTALGLARRSQASEPPPACVVFDPQLPFEITRLLRARHFFLQQGFCLCYGSIPRTSPGFSPTQIATSNRRKPRNRKRLGWSVVHRLWMTCGSFSFAEGDWP